MIPQNNPPSQLITGTTFDGLEALYDTEAEKMVCGAILLEPNAIFEVADILTGDMFSEPSCRKIFDAALSLFDKGTPVDMVSVANELISAGDENAYVTVSVMVGNISSAAHIVTHAVYVREVYLRRKLYYHLQDCLLRVKDRMQDISDVIDYAAKGVDDVLAGTTITDNGKPISETCNAVYDAYAKRELAARNGETAGISTGLSKLNNATGGWKPGELIVLAARPGVGKTAVMLHFATSAAKSGKPVAIFNLEMTAESLTERIILGASGVDAGRFKRGTLYQEEVKDMYAAGNEVSKFPITVDDTAQLSMRQIKNKAMRLHRQGKCDMVLIDYLQLVDMRTGEHNRTREQEVTAASRMAKIIAKDLGIPVILLSQLNRDADGQKPLLSHLRESGAIEQDADVVIFITRREDDNSGELIVAKQRNGCVGRLEFHHNESLTRIYDDNPIIPPTNEKDLPF